jgi:predicted MFS family arabinose efflux permease
MKKNLWLLAIAQGLFLTNNVVFIAINGLVGLSLAPAGWMATLPTGSTTLAMQAYRPEEKDKAQAAINFAVFATMALTSFASGALVTTQGWTLLNVGSLLPVALTGAALVWLALRQRRTPPVA